MSASLPVGCSDKYHPGFQKTALVRDRVFLSCVTLAAIFSAVTTSGSYLLGVRYRFTIETAMILFVVLPAAMKLAGGLPRNCRAKYAAAALLFGLAVVPAKESICYYSLPLALPAAYLLLGVTRAAPWLLKGLGFTGKKFSPAELPAIILPSIFLCGITHYTIATVEHIRVRILLPPEIYATHFLYSMMFFGATSSVMYGLLAERMLTLRYSILAAIVMNIFMHFLFSLPMSLGFGPFGYWLIAEVCSAATTQFFMGMTYYYFRSARPGLAIYVIYALYYNAAFLSR